MKITPVEKGADVYVSFKKPMKDFYEAGFL